MKRPFFLRLALRNRGRALMRRYVRLADHFGDGYFDVAEQIYPRLVLYRKRAMRIAMKLRVLA